MDRPQRFVLVGQPLPWFAGRRALTTRIVLLLFVVVFALQMWNGSPADATCMLYTLPVALAAYSLGRRAGLAAGLSAATLVGACVLIGQVGLTPAGWLSRAVPLALLGVLLGDASDRLRHAHARRRDLEAAALRQQDVAQINGTLVRGMGAALSALERGDWDGGLGSLNETIEQGHALVSCLLRDADMGLTRPRTPG